MSQPQSTVSIPTTSSIYPVLSGYQQHVHHLEKPASTEVIIAREDHLVSGIPNDLKQFLLTHNGVILFDGDLIVRSVMELTPVSTDHPSVIAFALMHIQVNPIQIDGVETELWAYVEDADGQSLYGLWQNEQFTPMYRDFQTWLTSCIRLLDEGTFPNIWKRRTMLAKVPVFFEYMKVDSLMSSERYSDAANILGEWLQENSTPKGWVQYAEALYSMGDNGWENSFIEAVKALHFPLPYPNIVPSQKNWISSIVHRVPIGASTIVEICSQIWKEEVMTITSGDILSRSDLEVLEEVALCMWEFGQNQMDDMKELLGTLNRLDPDFVPTRLLLSHIENLIDIAEHDKAETAIFALQRRCPNLEAECLLLLGHIVVRRHEPWGLHILFDLMDKATSGSILCEALLLSAQYCLDNESLTQASTFLDQAAQRMDLEKPGKHSAWYCLLKAQMDHYNQLVGPAGQNIKRGLRLVPNNNLWLKGWLYSTEASIFSSMQMLKKSEGLYEQAMNIFSEGGFKLEMAETLMKWGQSSKSVTYFQRARQLFRSIGFASGVSVADRYLGESDASWNWYMDMTKDLVQRHVLFQKVNTKGIRQEADRPERRLYGLQMAVADSNDLIVEHLCSRIYPSRQTIECEQVSTSHDQYAIFLSSLTLLLSHPSLKATEVIIDLVRTTKLGTVASEAIIAQLSRTNNTDLIDELVDLLCPKETISALVIVATVVGQRRYTQSFNELVHLLGVQSDTVVQQSCLLALGRLGDDRGLSCIDNVQEHLQCPEYWALSLLLLGDHSAITILVQQLENGLLGEHTRLGHLIGRYGGVSNLLLLKAMAYDNNPIRVSAIHGLGYIGDSRALPILLEMTGMRDRIASCAASHALELITGHHENTEDYLLKARWQAWLEENDQWVSGVRYRNGNIFSPSILIEGLQHDDRIVRMSSYDELVITTGVRLPFDVDGAWRVQKSQVLAWEQWWQEQVDYPIGRWIFQGNVYC